jgi:hypothetical protein
LSLFTLHITSKTANILGSGQSSSRRKNESQAQPTIGPF